MGDIDDSSERHIKTIIPTTRLEDDTSVTVGAEGATQ